MDVAFVLKKILTVFVTPIGFVLFLLVLAFFAIPVRRTVILRKKPEKEEEGEESSEEAEPSEKEEESAEFKRGRSRGGWATFLIAGAIFFLYCFSIEPVSHLLVGFLERSVPREVNLPAEFYPKYIVVLPSGVRQKSLPSSSRLSYPSLARFHGGIQYWRQFPEATLVFSGNEAEVLTMKEEALRAGVPEELIFEETKARDTRGHVVFLKSLLEGEPFLLVTSAIHLPRSMALFQAEGLQPVGVPVDFLARTEGGADFEARDLIPKAMYLTQSERAIHEIVGMIWAQWQGQAE